MHVGEKHVQPDLAVLAAERPCPLPTNWVFECFCLAPPKTTNRRTFEKAMVRVKGAVQQVRQPEATAYGGEATGIKSKVAKSRRL